MSESSSVSVQYVSSRWPSQTWPPVGEEGRREDPAGTGIHAGFWMSWASTSQGISMSGMFRSHTRKSQRFTAARRQIRSSFRFSRAVIKNIMTDIQPRKIMKILEAGRCLSVCVVCCPVFTLMMLLRAFLWDPLLVLLCSSFIEITYLASYVHDSDYRLINLCCDQFLILGG